MRTKLSEHTIKPCLRMTFFGTTLGFTRAVCQGLERLPQCSQQG